MKTRTLLRNGFALAALLSVGGVASAQTAPTVYIWDAGGIGQATPAAWGNGEAKTARERGNSSVLNITTRNFYEGARFDLKTPINLDPYREEGYLRLRVRLAGARSGRGVGGAGGFGGGAGGFGGGAGGIRRRGGMGGIAGGFRRGDGAPLQTAPLKQMQAIVMLERGALFGQIDLSSMARPGRDGFQIVMLRLRDMRPTSDASGGARRIVLTGDREATFALTQAAFVVESDSIAVSVRRDEDAPGTQMGEITVRPDIPFTLVADVEAGISDTEVTWNFDADNVGLPLPAAGGRGGADTATPGGMMPPGMMPGMPGAAMPGSTPGMAMPGATPGMPSMPGMGGATMPGGMMGGATRQATRVDATGLSAQLRFPNEEQDYRVEVTVRDRAGRKEDAKASILVRVRAAGV